MDLSHAAFQVSSTYDCVSFCQGYNTGGEVVPSDSLRVQGLLGWAVLAPLVGLIWQLIAAIGSL